MHSRSFVIWLNVKGVVVVVVVFVCAMGIKPNKVIVLIHVPGIISLLHWFRVPNIKTNVSRNEPFSFN